MMLATKLQEAAANSTLPTYIEDVFSTYLYTGNGSTQTITNGIDLSTKGGLTWIKSRSTIGQNSLYDTVRGATKELVSESTNPQTTATTGLTAFNSNGFSLGSGTYVNTNTTTYCSWTIGKQPKFFDIVTFTSDGTLSQTISHSLASAPGCILLKRTDSPQSWMVWHRGNGTTSYFSWSLNNTAAASTSSTLGAYMTSTSFQPNRLRDYLGNSPVNGGTYVAYLFAHNAGGFGLTGTDNVISCGSYTHNSTSGVDVNLGYEPQWILQKNAGAASGWLLIDNMRGWVVDANDQYLTANSSGVEDNIVNSSPTATGFKVDAGAWGNGANIIYIAIRRGPMKVPTSGTSVFSPVAYTGNATDTTRSAGFPVDMLAILRRSNPFGDGDGNPRFMDRLRGGNSTSLISSSASAEETSTNNTLYLDNSVGFKTTANNAGAPTGYYFNVSTNPYIAECFRRAPSFFDVVCYSGTGANQLVDHNLGVVPELVIFKARNDPSAQTPPWAVQVPNVLGTGYLRLNTIDANSAGFFAGLPTATQLKTRVNSNSAVNASGYNYVAYLFATCAGVSKVGSYTGNGSSQTINCGFTSGARFVLIKSTSAAGHWRVYDTARGIVAGNEPELFLNLTNAEQTVYDAIDTDSSGFIVNSNGANVNDSGVTYIFLAIA